MDHVVSILGRCNTLKPHAFGGTAIDRQFFGKIY
jgi:hypothetical protein